MGTLRFGHRTKSTHFRTIDRGGYLGGYLATTILKINDRFDSLGSHHEEVAHPGKNGELDKLSDRSLGKIKLCGSDLTTKWRRENLTLGTATFLLQRRNLKSDLFSGPSDTGIPPL